MRISRLAGVRVLFSLVSFAAFTLASTFAYSQALTLLQSGTRYAGTITPGFNGDFGSATTVSLNTPSYIVFDSQGNQYLSDTQNNCVRKIDPSGSMSTVVGFVISGQGDTCSTASNPTPTFSQGLYQPTGLAVDSSNNLYIADSRHNCVRMLANGASGFASLTTVAGTCGSAASSTPNPNGLVLDASNNLYISIQDTEVLPTVSTYQVLRQAPGASLCVMAGSSSTLVPNSCSGITGSVVLNAPSGLAINGTGDLFIADTGNNCVRQIANLATYKTVVGQCSNDSSGTHATALNKPYGLTFSPAQSLLITETNPDTVVSYILGSATLTVAAGLPSGAAGPYSPTQDGNSALSASLNAPRGIAVDSFGNFSLADSGNSIARKLSSNIIFPSTPVGSQSATMPLTFVINQNVNLSATSGPDFSITSNTCNGTLTPAPAGEIPTTCQVFIRFTPTRPGLRSAPVKLSDSLSGKNILQGLQAVATGSLSVFTPGTVNTIAGALAAPTAVAVDSAGNTYVLEAGAASGTADLLLVPAGGGTPQIVIPQGAGLLTPSALAIDSAGNFLIADATHGTVARFGADGTIDTSYVTALDTPTAIYVDGFDNLFIAQAGTTHNVIEVYAAGSRRTISSSFVSPSGLALDLNGILYIADAGGHLVYAVDKSGVLHQVAGNGTATTTVPGQATGTALLSPSSLSVDAAGDLYIADAGANLVYTVYASTTSSGSNIATVLGTGTAGKAGDGGFSNLAQVSNPISVAVDGSSNLFVVDNGNSSVREITYPNPTLAFGTIMVGQSSPLIRQNISNFGTDNLNLTSPFSSSDPHFIVDGHTTTCGTTIIAGSTCTIGFIFTPTANGPITATVSLATNSYNSPQPIQLTATGKLIAPLQFTLPAQTEVYGQPFPETVLVNNSNPAPTGTITFTLGKTILCSLATTLGSSTTCNAPNSGLTVGSYTVAFSYTGDSNYSSASGTVILTVTPAPLTVIVNNATREYGAANPSFTGTLTGVLPGETILVAYSSTATVLSPAGNFPIVAILTAAADTDLSNYLITNTPGTLTITQTPLTITVDDAIRQYGQPNPQFTSTTHVTLNGATKVGTLNGDAIDITYSTPAAAASPAGTYPINATASGVRAGSYLITIIPGTLTVTPAHLTVVVGNTSRAYGAPNPAFTSTVSGALNGDTFTVTYSTAATTTSPVGSYPIVPTVSGAATSNYEVVTVNGTLTITQNPSSLVINVDNASRPYGAPNPNFTGSVNGVLPGDNVVVTFTSPATQTSPAGHYAIGANVSGTSAGNYIATIHPGALDINPVATVTTITTSGSPATVGARVTFIATTTTTGVVSGTVNFSDGAALLGTGTLNSSGVATFSTTTLALGTHSITAAFQTNTNFTASSATLTQVMTAATGSFTISASPATQFIKGAGATIYQVTLTSVGAFAGQINLACSGLPADATCSFAGNPTLTAGGTATVAMTVNTTVADAQLREPAIRSFHPAEFAPITAAAVFPVELTGLGVFLAGLRRRKILGTQKMLLLAIILFSLGILGLTGCGCPSTVFQTYTINITATSVTFTAPAQSTSVLLSVGNQ
jgi:sugar lactone lactonase YvrE